MEDVVNLAKLRTFIEDLSPSLDKYAAIRIAANIY
jgi:hypothetical protein